MHKTDEQDGPQQLMPACPHRFSIAQWYAMYLLRVLWALPWVLGAMALLLFVAG